MAILLLHGGAGAIAADVENDTVTGLSLACEAGRARLAHGGSALHAALDAVTSMEANESAFKTVRYYWKRMGKPGKVKVIAREHAYHGVTLAAMSATGMAAYWQMFEPRVPNFSHIPAPYFYRFTGEVKPGESIGQAAARARPTLTNLCSKGRS